MGNPRVCARRQFGWVRLVAVGGALAGAVAAGLVLTLLWLDAWGHEGYRPEWSELVSAAVTVVAVAGLAVGFRSGVRPRGRVGPVGRSFGSRSGDAVRSAAALAAAGAVAVTYLTANELTYRFVVPLGSADPSDRPVVSAGDWLAGVGWSVTAAAAGFVLGLAWRRATSSTVTPVTGPTATTGTAGRGRYLVAAAVLVGLFSFPEFVRVGAELATVRFLPATAVSLPVGQPVTVDLPAGRSAIFRTYGRQLSTQECRVVGPTGAELPVTAPSVAFSDNSDSVVTVLLGTVEVPSSSSVSVTCQGMPGHRYQIGPAPTVDGPLGPLLYVPSGVLWSVGALPGLTLAAWLAVERRRGQSSARQR